MVVFEWTNARLRHGEMALQTWHFCGRLYLARRSAPATFMMHITSCAIHGPCS